MSRPSVQAILHWRNNPTHWPEENYKGFDIYRIRERVTYDYDTIGFLAYINSRDSIQAPYLRDVKDFIDKLEGLESIEEGVEE